jgi:hypothetical protein
VEQDEIRERGNEEQILNKKREFNEWNCMKRDIGTMINLLYIGMAKHYC